MTIQLNRDEILGAYASVAAPADWWHTAQAADATDEGEAHEATTRLSLSPWLIAVVGIGILMGLVAGLVWLYALPVELNRIGVWTPPPPDVAAVQAVAAGQALAVTQSLAWTPGTAMLAPPTPAIDYAAQPVMRIWCDGNPVDLVSTSQITADLTRRCWADYGWCETCQLAWMAAHP